MARSVDDAEIRGYEPANSGSTPDYTIAQSDIQSFDHDARIQDLIDQAEITIRNDDAGYTGTISSGDRIEWVPSFSGDLSGRDGRLARTRLGRGRLAQTAPGDGPTEASVRWTGMIRTIEHEEVDTGRQVLNITADDFVFGIMDNRYVENAFKDRQITGGATDSILQIILDDNATEIGQSQIDSGYNTTATLTWNSVKLLEAVKELADRVNALVAQDGTDLVFKPLADVDNEFTLTPADRGLATVEVNDDKLRNEVRVEGGEDASVDDEQTTQSSTTTVTESSRLTHQISTTKSEVTQVEIYTQTTGSDENIIVRLQKDDSGSPVDISDDSQDIARRELAPQFLDSDGLTTFQMPSHALPEPNPWLIIESDGSSGQDIGVDGNGTPTYKAYYPFPLASVIKNKASIDDYRRREHVYRDQTAKTREMTDQRARSVLDKVDDLKREIRFPAESKRAFQLAPGDGLKVDNADLGFQADAIVLERSETYQANLLETEITAAAEVSF